MTAAPSLMEEEVQTHQPYRNHQLLKSRKEQLGLLYHNNKMDLVHKLVHRPVHRHVQMVKTTVKLIYSLSTMMLYLRSSGDHLRSSRDKVGMTAMQILRRAQAVAVILFRDR